MNWFWTEQYRTEKYWTEESWTRVSGTELLSVDIPDIFCFWTLDFFIELKLYFC